MIEGRDIGTVVAPERRGEGLPRRRPRRAGAAAHGRPPGIGADALATDLRLRDEKDAARMQPAEDAREIDTTDLRRRGRRRADRSARARAHRRVNRVDVAWAIGKPVMGSSTAWRRGCAGLRNGTALPARGGRARVLPLRGGGGPAVVSSSRTTTSRGSTSRRSAGRRRAPSTSSRRPRRTRCRSYGAYLRLFGSFGVRRGESDREAVRRMRDVVRGGARARGLRRGHAAALGRARAGAAGRRDGRAPGGRARRLRRDLRLARVEARQLQAGLDRLRRADALHGPPAERQGLPRGVGEIEAELRRLWEWLRDLHAAGRPRHAVPPRAPEHLRAPVTLVSFVTACPAPRLREGRSCSLCGPHP